MGRSEGFEDLVSWQKARALAGKVYIVTRKSAMSRDFALVNQLRGSAISVVSNIAEGYERRTPGEFSQFLVIAKGSCGELRAQLYLALDAGYLSESEFDELRKLADEVSRVIAGLIAAVQRRKRQ